MCRGTVMVNTGFHKVYRLLLDTCTSSRFTSHSPRGFAHLLKTPAGVGQYRPASTSGNSCPVLVSPFGPSRPAKPLVCRTRRRAHPSGAGRETHRALLRPRNARYPPEYLLTSRHQPDSVWKPRWQGGERRDGRSVGRTTVHSWASATPGKHRWRRCRRSQDTESPS